MKLLRVGVGGVALDLHPKLTVVRGLDNHQRAALTEAVNLIANGRAGSTIGLLEAHGVLLDLTDENLVLLGLADAGGAHPIVTAADVLGARDRSACERGELEWQQQLAAARLAVADEELARVERSTAVVAALARGDRSTVARVITEARDAATAAASARRLAESLVDVAQQEEAVTEAGLATVERDLVAARERRRTAASACTAAMQALAAASSRRDLFAAVALAVAQTRQASPVDTDASEHDADRLAERAAALEAKRAQLQAEIVGLEASDPYPVEAALAALEGAPPDLVPDAIATALAHEWTALAAAVADDGAVVEVDVDALDAPAARVEAAQLALLEAERSARALNLDPEVAAELERTHEHLLQLQEQATRRRGGQRVNPELDAARAAENALLERLGFVTYTDFVVGRPIANAAATRDSIVRPALAELEAAQRAQSALMHALGADLARYERARRRLAITRRAGELLGRSPGDDLATELRALRVADTVDGPRFDRLRAALDSAGIAAATDDLPGDIAVEIGRIWLEEHASAQARRPALDDELVTVEIELASVRTAQAAHEAGAPARDDRARADALREALDLAAARVVADRAVDSEIAEARHALASCADEERKQADEVCVCEQAVVDVSREVDTSARTRARLETDLAAARDSEAKALAQVAALEVLEPRIDSADVDTRLALEAAATEAAEALAAAQAERSDARSLAAGLGERLRSLPDGPALDPREVEIDLLGRIAEQRDIARAGAVPTVLLGPLDGLPEETTMRLFGRCAQMAACVQVLVVSDDDAIADHAARLGPDHAGVVGA